MLTELKNIIEGAWDNRELLNEDKTQNAIRTVIEELDKGRLRLLKESDKWQEQLD